MTKCRDPQRIYDIIQKRRWYPAAWGHHPAEVKAAFKTFKWRPQLKYCWQNCQRFLLDAYRHGMTDLLSRLSYHEGYVLVHGVMTPHAWLRIDGDLLELTVDPSIQVIYLKSYEVSLASLLARTIQNNAFVPDEAKLAKIRIVS
jgi:hypothetical protein